MPTSHNPCQWLGCSIVFSLFWKSHSSLCRSVTHYTLVSLPHPLKIFCVQFCHLRHVFLLDDMQHRPITKNRGKHKPKSVTAATEYYTEVHLHCFWRKLYSSLSKYRKQKQSPPWTCTIFSISRGDCFCLRYLLSDESWRIELTQKTMEMDFCVVFCAAATQWFVIKMLSPCL